MAILARQRTPNTFVWPLIILNGRSYAAYTLSTYTKGNSPTVSPDYSWRP